MKVIFAKHDRCDKEFMFEVPKGMNPSEEDILWVDTYRGETTATATSDVIEGENVRQLVERFGAYMPLKLVRTYANEKMVDSIRRVCYAEIQELIKKEQSKIGEFLPF